MKKYLDDNKKKDTKLSYFILLFYVSQMLNSAIKVTFYLNDRQWFFLSMFFMCFLAIILILNIKVIFSRGYKIFLTFEMIFLLLYSISIINGVNINIILDYSLWTMGVSIPLAVALYSINNRKIFTDVILKYSKFMILIHIFAMIFMKSDIENVYSMSLSYSMLFPTIMYIFYGKKNSMWYILLLLTFVTIMLYGARGALITLILGLLSMIYKNAKINIKNLLLSLAFISITLIIILNYNFIIDNMILLLDTIGLYSRTLVTLRNNNFLESSGREVLFNYYIKLIFENPIFGYGLLGGWIDGTSPHNLLIEVLLAFGVLIGSLLNLLFIFIILNPLLKKRIDPLLTVYSLLNFTMLFVMGEFLMKYNLFILILISIKYYWKGRDINENNNLNFVQYKV